MREHLYWKFVLTFLIGVLGSLILSYYITTRIAGDVADYEDELSEIKQGVIHVYQLAGDEDKEKIIPILTDLGIDATVQSVDGLSHALTASEINQLLTETTDDHFVIKDIQRLTKDMYMMIDPEIGEVLHVHIDLSDDLANRRQLMIRTLMFVLVSGSIFILFASRYFVKSIKKLTVAAKEVTRGNFDVDLKTEREDEIGQLMVSFDEMIQTLKSTDESRKAFVSNVSHEIQSPLTSIKGNTKAIQDGVIHPEDEAKYLAIIYQETDRLSRLSTHLLKLQSLDDDHFTLNKQTYRLDEQIRSIILTTAPLWQAKDLMVNVDLEPLSLELDEDLMELVWINLITNAIKFTDVGGTIDINYYLEHDRRVIRIHDTGRGIPEDKLPYIFDRFYKVDDARSEKNAGSGLGLSIVKKIIHLHDGDIHVVSDHHQGTTFFVRLKKY
ncbi:Signal transduction histidine kinase [Halolactibacillus halophilus]|uniref:Heme sensor protein HssS n=1 Tax=Halolactibacillus halophilus TaxID=306540 RepID=A0A1I5QZ91_9BACI|nr:HAMP domain-containing sensor histidine kinase [Halolactibacillus halophilus]GEM01975.1 two-component sensor histidine kinase [Halolactibacillus halophilus]SFP51624.1 Signal transduction histidine kinase [Halolactibacillus halophilus]